MSEDEKLVWYNIVCDILEEELDNNEDIIIEVLSFYWADSIYKNMKAETMLLCVCSGKLF